jgi:hypothetical protein
MRDYGFLLVCCTVCTVYIRTVYIIIIIIIIIKIIIIYIYTYIYIQYVLYIYIYNIYIRILIVDIYICSTIKLLILSGLSFSELYLCFSRNYLYYLVYIFICRKYTLYNGNDLFAICTSSPNVILLMQT